MRVLCLVEYYLPAHRAGGPIRSLVSLVQALGDEFEFRIVTRNRDWSSNEPYRGIEPSRWVPVGKAHVWYLPQGGEARELKRLLRTEDFDAIYLNSFFSPLFSVLPLMGWRMGWLRSVPVLVAPRGELAGAAVSLKPLRKRAYLLLAKALGLYDRAWFHAASPTEAARIEQVLGAHPDRILVAANTLDSEERDTRHPLAASQVRAPGPLRIVFLSRLSATQNLDFLIEALHQVRTPVECRVYGSASDKAYWRRCQALAQSLPAQVRLTFHGAVEHREVSAIFAAHDVFFFPTRTESFGHVIAESLRAGTPVVTSDQTPWVPDGSAALQTLPILQPQVWAQAIEHWCRFDEAALSAARLSTHTYLSTRPGPAEATQASRQLFDRIRRAATPMADRP